MVRPVKVARLRLAGDAAPTAVVARPVGGAAGDEWVRLGEPLVVGCGWRRWPSKGRGSSGERLCVSSLRMEDSMGSWDEARPLSTGWLQRSAPVTRSGRRE